MSRTHTGAYLFRLLLQHPGYPLIALSLMPPYEKTEGHFEHDSPVATLRSIVDVRVFPLLLETVLLSIFTIQTIYFVYHRCSNAEAKPNTRAHRRPNVNSMLCLSICMYLLVLVYWVLDVIILRQELLVFLPEQFSSTPSPDVYETVTQMLGALWYAQAILQVLIWTASDIVALWRAYVVIGKVRWLKITTVIVLLVEIGVYLAKSETSSKRLIVQVPYLTAASTTVAVQILTTSLIAYKAWAVWKSRQGLFNGPGRVFRALAVLIESGVAYTLLWIWYFIATNDSILSWKITAWTDYYLMPITAMYPTLVVMIVTLQDIVLANVETSPGVPRTCPTARATTDGMEFKSYSEPEDASLE
ncbi:hypothetical protein PENSPDRAFT_220651 [Peniophora sp. CONT]|nr:hypothetical protein PENSPDRAFT_220651 [Peniophora sp. CONT]